MGRDIVSKSNSMMKQQPKNPLLTQLTQIDVSRQDTLNTEYTTHEDINDKPKRLIIPNNRITNVDESSRNKYQ